MKITNIKEIRDIETNELTGYILNNSIHIPISGSRFDEDIKKFLSNGGVITPAFTNEERLEYLKGKFINKAESFADLKTSQAEGYVANKTKITENQRKRYESKYILATRYKDNPTDEDKELLLQIGKQVGLDSVDDVVALLIKLHDEWLEELHKFNLLIDYARIEFTKDVTNNFTLENKELFEYKFNLLKELGIEITYDGIDDIISITELPTEENKG